MESIYKRYVPALAPEPGGGGPGYWFAFCSGRLLLAVKGGVASIPLLECLQSIGIAPVRTQYLGTLEKHPCYVAEISPGTEAPEGTSLNELRATYSMLDEDLYVLAGRALQISAWDQTTQYCGRCGHKTEPLRGERANRCPACGLASYPRLSPAVITAVLKEDKILLARRPGTRAMYSILAGFVEPGETLEECLDREVFEEVGVRVKNARYFTSQPWPFPNSLMIGFIAEWESGEISVDGSEITEAGWYGADRLPEIPPKMTIARQIIDWFVENRSRPGGHS